MIPLTPFVTFKRQEAPLLTTEEFKALTARVHRNSLRYSVVFDTYVYAGMIFLFLTTFGVMWGVGLMQYLWALAVTTIFTLIVAAFTVNIRKDNWEIERILKFVNATEEADMLGPILNLKNSRAHPGDIHSHIEQAVDQAVLRLLPYVRPGHANTLNKSQRVCIQGYIWKGDAYKGESGFDNLPYARGVLHAMEQIGDKHDLPELEKLLLATSINKEFCEAVQHCLDAIAVRALHQASKDVLLRPQHKPESIETLVRPSEERQDTPSEQLLRAVTAGESPPHA